MYRIYYADETTYDGDPFNAPAFGVLLILEPDKESGRRFVSNGDFYIWTGERWFDVDYFGLIDYLAQPGHKKVIFGRLVSNEDWHKIYFLADNDPDFPRRTCWGNQELEHRTRP